MRKVTVLCDACNDPTPIPEEYEFEAYFNQDDPKPGVWKHIALCHGCCVRMIKDHIEHKTSIPSHMSFVQWIKNLKAR